MSTMFLSRAGAIRSPARRQVLNGLCAAAAMCLSASAMAQGRDFPNRPVTIIVPFPAGATMDGLARRIGRSLSEQWKQPVVVENPTGAGGILGTSMGARAAKDGYTLVMISNSFVVNTLLRRDMPYDAFADFTPVTLIGAVPHVLVAHRALGVRTVDELRRYGASHPGKLSYSSGGIGTMSHFAGEMLRSVVGLDITHVPYRGQGPSLAAVTAGQVSINFANLPEILPLMKDGRVTALAVAQASRSQLLPNVPTFAELGMPSVESDSWYGLIAPNGVDPAIISSIHTSIARALGDSELRHQLLAGGLEPAGKGPTEFENFMRAKAREYQRVIVESKIKLDQ